ncbi:hypothetical protein QUF84_19440 [Fictibacillus enclensis]|uniref:Uncharacterized protein n=2 Tax=Fictibacillus TaxID=1329200 RepID=A0A0V8JAJ2_9BACL|nr:MULTISPECIES: hypothetical protein [Fictibacillus]KSU83664.1 hypothetical protein AS030_14060 [Fictibacillus enclensis]MDM5200065.1 hypothetical protein [Fictibacillus enclensis]MDM5339377.1 hypothetical protein [Fictibacillus enclensis]RXZ02487.1 hypothetical protein DMO16_24255 [Fictibacillus sp. S7]WHY70827.1 hypothetical protein QNH15_17520 [Fictibacillus enclensis]
MIINRKEIAREQVKKIQNGFSAFAETKEVAELIKKELMKLNIPVHEDTTDLGSWFIPEKS